MTRRLLAATCLTPIGLALATPALADTTISTSTTANVRTSTANSGAADNVVISSAGTITPAAGTAVTIDSNNTVNNAGTITAGTTATDGIDNVVAIGGGGGFTSGIVNSGTISIGESYVQTDTNADTVLDGPFATGTGRYGVLLSGSAPFVGSITNTGAITIKGNNSGGIVSNVAITGNVINSGAITVTGDNSYGVKLGAVTGNVTLAGATSATGLGSVATAITGDVSGQIVVHSALTSTGYSSTTLPATLTSLTAQNLLQGGSALSIGGNVGGGVLIALVTTATDTTLDVDNDGLGDTTEATGSLTTYGSAPALSIGSATQAVTLGTFSGSTAGLVINGTVLGSGVYAGNSATGVLIGGLDQPVTITGGIIVGGSITASANAANATGIEIGSGASVPSLTVNGSISANSTTNSGGISRAILIDAGGNLRTIANTGTITATPVTSAAQSWAIQDNSGTLTSVTNTGTISATANADNTRAIDVSANTTGFTYTQSQSSTVTTVPVLLGAVVTGSGNDSFLISAGTVTSDITTGAGNDSVALSGSAAMTGATVFGAGNDSLSLAGTSTYTGNVTFGAGADTLTIGDTAVFTGQLLNTAGNLAVSVTGGTLGLTNTGAISIASLSLNGGTIGVTIDPATGTHTEIDVAGATSITGASTFKVSLTSLAAATTSYTILKSGTLTGSANLGVTLVGLPYLLTGSLTGSDSSGTVAVNIERKTAAQIGLLRSESSAYNAVYSAVAGNSQLTTLFLGLTDRDSFLQRYRQMLPDYAGGVFDLLNTGARNMAPGEGVTPWTRVGDMALWVQQSFWNANQKATDDTTGYKGTGYGASIGGDIAVGDIGRVGVSGSYVFADIKDRNASSVTANQFIGNLYWRGDFGGFHLGASGGGGFVSMKSKRSLAGADSSTPILLSDSGKWNGMVIQGNARASYEIQLGAFYARPAGTVSYFRLHEKGYSESGGGNGYDLVVDPRTSEELAATGTMALGLRFGSNKDPDATGLTIELEGGRRQIINSALDATTAHFSGGEDFSLDAQGRESGYVGTLSASVGSQLFRFVASATTEERSGYRTVLGRVSLRGIF